MSDLFDDLDFEMLGGDFEDPFENEPVDPVPPVCLTQGISLCSIRKPLRKRLLKPVVLMIRHSSPSLIPLSKRVWKAWQIQRCRLPKLMATP